jgi:hypothetical protein
MVQGCSLDNPTSPNDPGDLQGQTPYQPSDFTGTVQIVLPTATLPADDLTTLPITAVVEDSSGQPVANLTPVSFRTTKGAFIDPETGELKTELRVSSFGGSAVANLRSFQREYGEATVYASVGSVSDETEVEFEYVGAEASMSLAFRLQGQDFFNMTGVTSPGNPFTVGLVASVLDLTGNPSAGTKVQFRIVSDSTTHSGSGGARLQGQPVSYTNVDGEAFNQLQVRGVGEVVLEADLIDPVTDELIGTSNQIIYSGASFVQLDLTIEGGTSATGGGNKNLKARATDASGLAIPYIWVQFEIQADATNTAKLSPVTDIATEWGNARSVLSFSGGTAGNVTTIVAKVIDSQGTVLATSNTVDNIY